MPVVGLLPGPGGIGTLAGAPLIGDLIIDTRVLGPDPSATAPAPSGITAAVATVSSNALPVGTYRYVFTNLTNWGETLPTSELPIAIGANQSIQVSGTLPAGIAGGRIYLSVAGGASGTEYQFFQYSTLPIVVNSSQIVAGQPPTKSSAWMPDTDGQFLPASVLYMWMRDVLELACSITGGITDLTGAPSVQSQPMYVLPGRWSSLSDFWYDGYIINRGTRKDNYYRAPLVSLSWTTTRVRGFQQWTMELFPQPQRTAGTGTLSSGVAIGDTVASVTFTGSFVLPLGLARIGGVAGEIVYYSGTSATQLTGLTRGFSGTVAQAWSAGAVVDELNINAMGKRYPNIPTLGQATQPLDVPAGWYTALHKYMMYRYRLAEQQHAEAGDLYKAFVADMAQWQKSNKMFTGPKQAGGPSGIEVFYPSQFHGWVMPAWLIGFMLPAGLAALAVLRSLFCA